ncbi:MAG: hypothetical protein LBR47_07950 [Spirochaetaceae bacterium]|jgi:acyl-ACP thioesterase|nr:hypothetical protein [Spirochaetaceae bacterium]
MYSLTERVCASHTNAEGALKFVSAVDMMQDCSQMWMESEPVFGQYFREHTITQILVSRQIDVNRMPRYGEKLLIQTSVYECRSFHGFRNTVIYDEANRPCLTSWSTGAFVSLDTERMAKIPGDIIDQVVIDPKVEMEYLDRKITLPGELPGGTRRQAAEERKEAVAVKRHDIDFNRHMNNARYVQIAFELLPEDFIIERFRIEYKTPVKYGDTLHPKVIVPEEKNIFILLENGTGNLCCIMEFTGKK